jgi:HK97 family phage portal protein
MSAVWRATWVIANVGAAIPLHSYARGTRDRRPSALLDDPNDEMTPFEVWRQSFAHRALWGNSYAQKVRHAIRAQGVRHLHPLDPSRMQVRRYPAEDKIPGNKLFEYTDEWGTAHALSSYDVFHVPGFGYDGTVGCSPIRAAAEGISLALAAKRSGAKFFKNGAMLSGVLQVEQRLADDAAAKLKARWKARIQGSDNAYDIAVLDSGAKFNPVTMPLKDAQFLETRQFEVVEVARFFGVPLFLMFETQKSTSWGTGLEQQALGWVQFDLGPAWLTPTEQRITKELIPAGEYSQYTLEGLLRGDSAARAAFYRIMREVGAYNANEIRALENRGPIKGGDTYLQPVNLAPLGSDPTRNDPPPDDDDDQDDEDGDNED